MAIGSATRLGRDQLDAKARCDHESIDGLRRLDRWDSRQLGRKVFLFGSIFLFAVRRSGGDTLRPDSQTAQNDKKRDTAEGNERRPSGEKSTPGWFPTEDSGIAEHSAFQ